eukprot:1989458-Rhodomonas_salina.1
MRQVESAWVQQKLMEAQRAEQQEQAELNSREHLQTQIQQVQAQLQMQEAQAPLENPSTPGPTTRAGPPQSVAHASASEATQADLMPLPAE